MKQKVIEFLKNLPESLHDQFNEAYELYRKSEGKNVHVERTLNTAGFSELRLENLLYDLKKIHDISDIELVEIPVIALVSEEEEEGTASYEDEGKKTDDSYNELSPEFMELQVEKTGLTVREEFPFLNDKECPDELKILVADKMTAWSIYTNAHEKLFKKAEGTLELTPEEETELVKIAAEAFEENQNIYAELNAYKETGKILGEHPIFKKLQFAREVEEMTPDELVKYKNGSAKYFTDNKKLLAKAEAENDEARIQEVKARVADREIKLAMVNKKLGIQTK